MIVLVGYLYILAFFALILINIYKLFIFLMYVDQLKKYRQMRTKQNIYKNAQRDL